MSKEDWDKLDRRARSTIRLCLADSVLLNVSGESTAKELWDKLGSLYQSKSLVNKLFLRKKLYHLRMEDGDSMTEHLNAFNTLVSQLGSVNITIAEEDKCITLLCSLPDSWDNLVVAIGSTTQPTLKYEDVVASLLSEEMRRKSMDGHSTDALFVRGRPQERNPGKPSGWRSKSTGRSKSPGKSLRKCWKCGKTGHYKKDCRSKKVEKPKGSDSTSSTEVKPSTEEGGDVYLASTSTHADHGVWLIDSGASYHMTPHREWFSEYEKYDGGDVFLGDDSTAKILGRGRVKLLLNDGRIRTLPGVLHIPKLARSLISVSKLGDAGIRTIFEKDTCKMVRGAMVLMRGVRCGTLYKLLGRTYTNGCNSSVVLEQKNEGDKTNTVPEKKTMLWHQRLGHIGEKGLRTLHGKGMIEGMSYCTLDFDFCENCIYGKHNRVRFPSGATRAKGILELIHSDVFGPVLVPSLGKSVYYVSFIDDFSRNTWIYFLRNKSEVFDKFKEFKALVENQTEKKIKVLRTDNGGELCKKCGIARQKTTPYTPQQNGVAERMNRTLMEKARSMLSGARLGQEFWAEAVSTACYLVNRSPSSALDDTTPHEVWSGKKPSLQHLRVFGCDAYVHVPKKNRSKLDNKAEKCIFIGYKDGVKGYKLWNPETKKIVYSRDVVFREVKDVTKQEFSPTQDEPEKIELELDDAKSESFEEEEAEEAEEPEAEEEEPHTPELRRSVRDRRQPERYSPPDFRSNFSLSITDDDPRTVREAVNSEDSKLWKKAMVEEMDALDKNEAWDIVELPAGRKTVGSKWLFKKKFNAEGKVEKYKARLVAKGYSQVEGIDFGEIFSPVAKLTSIRFILSIAAAFDLEVEQMDVKTTFLHGDLEEEIYMKQPEGFVVKGKKELVCKLKKSLYGLKQSPGMWYQKFDTYILELRFVRSRADHCVYSKQVGNHFIYVVLYVDDMLLVGNNMDVIKEVKSQLSSKFDMKDLGAANFILGMEIKRDRANKKLWLNQRKYVETILQRFNMHGSKPVKVPIPIGVKLSADQCPKTQEEEEGMSHVPYASAVSSLMYAMVCTRPDIAHAVGVLSRYMSKPGKEHWTTAKRVFRYLRGTTSYGLCYQGRPGLDIVVDIHGFVDADWAGDLDRRRSTSGYVFNLFGGAISWMSKRQAVVALSTTEAEYMAATHASKEAIWLQRLCSGIGLVQQAVILDCDSQSAIFLAKNPSYHSKTKHIDVQYHFVRDMVEEKKVLLEKVDTLKNVADSLTKSVSTEKFSWCRVTMGIAALDC
jgi:hypothetical protein